MEIRRFPNVACLTWKPNLASYLTCRTCKKTCNLHVRNLNRQRTRRFRAALPLPMLHQLALQKEELQTSSQRKPELKGSIGEGPNQTNYSDRSSVRILGIEKKITKKHFIEVACDPKYNKGPVFARKLKKSEKFNIY